MSRLYPAFLVVTGCAIAGPGQRQGSPDARQSPTDAPRDSRTIDSPSSSGTCAQAFTGVLATWDFSAAAGNQASTAATSTAPGITAGGFTRSAGLTATSGTGSINSTGWPSTTTPDNTKYYTVTITPPAGCSLALSSAAVDTAHSSTGPTMGAMATSADSFATKLSISTAMAQTPSLVVSGGTTQLEIRIYGYSASSTSGTFRIQNTFSLSGSLH